MLKVLIVDDEIKVCRLIQCLVDWEALGLELIGFAQDGLTALDYVKQYSPDIVITDIRMPNYDGLDLIKNSLEINKNIHFIIISGYSQFDYAQKAIKFGVDDYLLKPVKKKELLQTLQKLITKHQALKDNLSEKEEIKKQLTFTEKKLKRNFLSELLEKSTITADSSNPDEINKHYHCNFVRGNIQLLLIQPVIKGSNTDSRVYEFVLSKIRDTVAEDLSLFSEVISIVRSDYVYCLINGTNEEFSRLRKQLKKFRTAILELKDVIGDFRLFIALSSEKSDLSGINDCKREVRIANLNKLISGADLLEYTNIKPAAVRSEQIVDGKFRKEFLFNIETLNHIQQKILFDKLKSDIKSVSNLTGQLVFDVYKELIDLFKFSIRTYGIIIKNENLLETLMYDFFMYCSVDEVFDNLLQRIDESLDTWTAEKKLENSKPIRLAKQFINENYNQALTLEIIGDKIGFNPTYFSSVFKKETGMNFVDYITEIRVQNAKQILVDTDKSIIDISTQVGFNDIKYFTKKFKKSTGLSPTEYRKLYS